MDILFAAVLSAALLAVLAGELAARPPATLWIRRRPARSLRIRSQDTARHALHFARGTTVENLAFPLAAMVDPQSIDPSHWKDRMQT
ncbi:hypothetical protein B0H11DRAFT_2230909 [Mycena galericulata]|nr:hypothetical protein B0H11DRAFT_2230909 [Mycena galericulata]